jgi:hypothetical protein
MADLNSQVPNRDLGLAAGLDGADAALHDIEDVPNASGGTLTLTTNNEAVTDSTNGLLINDAPGITGGVVTLGVSQLSLIDDAVGLTIKYASGVSGGTLTLDAGNLGVTDDASGLVFNDASGITGGSITLGANNLGLTDDASGLVVASASGVTGGTITLGAAKLGLTDNATTQLTILEAAGVTSGTITYDHFNTNITDGAGTLTINDASGVTGGNATFDASKLTIIDDATGGLGLGAVAGVKGDHLTFGLSHLSVVTSINGLSFSAMAGDTGDTVMLGTANVGIVVGSNGIVLADGSGVTGGTLTLNASGITVGDNAAGLAVVDASGVSGGTLTLQANVLSFTDDAAGLTVADAAAVSGGTVTLGASGLTLTDNANATTVKTSYVDTIALGTNVTASLAGTAGDVVNLAGSNSFTSISSGLTINIASSTNSLTVSGATLNLLTADAGATITGSNDQVTSDSPLSVSALQFSSSGTGDVAYWDNVSGNSNVTELFNPSAGVAAEFQYLTGGLDGSGFNTESFFNLTTGHSYQEILSGLPTGVGEQVNFYSGLYNGSSETGSLTQQNTDYKAGNSQVELFGPSSGISTEYLYFTGPDGSGTDTKNFINLTAGGSQEDLFTGLPSNVGTIVDFYSGAYNGSSETGSLTQQNTDYTAGNSLVELFNPSSAVSTEYRYYTAANGTGSNTEDVYNLTAGGSQQYLYTGLPSNVGTTVNFYTGPFNGTSESGSLTQQNTDYTAGNSQIELFNPSSTVSTEYRYYTGADGGGTNTQDDYNLTAGGSQQYLFSNLPSNVGTVVNFYTGAYNGSSETGTLTQQNTDYKAGNSQIELFNLSSPFTTAYQYYTGPDGSGSNTQNNFNYTGGSQQQIFTTGSVDETYSDYSGSYNGSSESGTVILTTQDFTGAGSQTKIFNPDQYVNLVTLNYSGANDSGTLTTGTVNLSPADGSYNIDIAYSSSGTTLTGYHEKWYTSAGGYIGEANFNGSGGYLNGSFGGQLSSGDGFGLWGRYGAVQFSDTPQTKGANIGDIAQFDRTVAHDDGATQAMQRMIQAMSAVSDTNVAAVEAALPDTHTPLLHIASLAVPHH